LHKRVDVITAEAGQRGLALDVGCGTGVLADALSSVGWTVIGVDASFPMLQPMRRRSGQPTHASACQLPFPAGAFDLVYTVASLHHIADPKSVRTTLTEMQRVCKPGGVIVVWDHNSRNPYWPIVMARVPQDTGAERIVPAEEITAAISQPEMQDPHVHYLGFVPDFAPKALLPALRWAERFVEAWPALGRYLCAHNVVVVRKRDLSVHHL
jgi:SAM-dependent methyltransferase